jgi:hypothetical protein
MLRNKDFYQGSVGGQVIFANLELTDELPSRFSVYIDGTFGVTPYDSRQLLVILAELEYKPRPIVFALMTEKSAEKYQIIFQFIQDAIFGPHRGPNSLMSDFESAIISAIKKVWPGVPEKGCNFHFGKAVRKNAKQISELSVNLTSDTIHEHVLSMFIRLSFLPVNNIKTGYDSLLKYVHENNIYGAFKKFIAYFHSTWMVRFPPELWSVGEEHRRTNNNLEGFNNKIKHHIPNKPSGWVFLDGLLALCYDASSSFFADRLKNAPPPRDQSYITETLNGNLLALAFGEINEMEFLKNMSKYEEYDLEN